MAFLKNIPQGNDNISTSQPQILGNNSFLGSIAGNVTNGYYIFPNGLILQWGGDIATGGSDQPVVTFNIPFTSAWFTIELTPFQSSSDNVGKYCVDNGFAASVTDFRYRFSGFSGSSRVFMWIAIGV